MKIVEDMNYLRMFRKYIQIVTIALLEPFDHLHNLT